MIDIMWEVSYVTKKGKPHTISSYSEDDARGTLARMKDEYAICTLTKVEVEDYGVETQVYRWRYTKGELTSETNDIYRRSKIMVDTQTDVEGSAFEAPPMDNSEREAAKAAKAAEREAAKEAKALAKAERDAARAVKKAEREQLAADKKAAREAAIARGEVLPTAVRKSKWADTAVITWGAKYTGDNPKREGSLAHASFSHYVDGMTIGEYKASGAHNPLGNIAWDVDREFISVAQADSAPTEDAPTEAAPTEQTEADVAA